MKTTTTKITATGSTKTFFVNDVAVCTFWFNRTCGKYGPATTGKLTDTKTSERTDLSDLSYYKDVVTYITERYT